MFANKRFINTGAYISNSKRFYNAKTWAHYFYVRRKILLNFHICISVSPLKTGKTMPKYGECLMASSLINKHKVTFLNAALFLSYFTQREVQLINSRF